MHAWIQLGDDLGASGHPQHVVHLDCFVYQLPVLSDCLACCEPAQPALSVTYCVHIAPCCVSPGGLLGLVVACGQSAAGNEATQADGDDGSLRATHNHDIGITVADVVGSSHEGVVGGGAGGGDGVVGAHEALVDGQQSATHVGDGIGDEEGGDLLVALLHQVDHTCEG